MIWKQHRSNAAYGTETPGVNTNARIGTGASTNNPPRKIAEDDPTMVTTQGLIALHHGARSIPLKTSNIRAQQSGGYVSPFKGRGMEFDEVRPYQPGDDVRTLDWRVTARTGKPHTKLFREERERAVLMWVDYRRPMYFATRGAFKSVIAARAAALLAWSAVNHGDRLGGQIFSEQAHHEVRPQRGKKSALHFIQQLVDNQTWLSAADQSHDVADAAQHSLGRMRRVARPGSLVFLISDFRHLGNTAEMYLGQMSRSCDVVMLFVYDPLESELPPGGIYRVSDGQRSTTLHTGTAQLRQDYRDQFQLHVEKIKRLCKRHGIYLLPCLTNENLLETLQRGLGLKK